MCRDIAWWEVNEVQIPGNKIEPQWPFLDTLRQKRDGFDILKPKTGQQTKADLGTLDQHRGGWCSK
jgi:hypothetical protein